ncbi:hypothetical protein NQ315_001537 [Exocentrus adspersus]|uniref:Uncharacterized protein n=1 Tax=Exocentrus adspersus TaxID=1586481 RepID=A0AAV8W8X2_9CUCU|nr:hypothetical protein NQ315_001537 [Exocentrus adspersus]
MLKALTFCLCVLFAVNALLLKKGWYRTQAKSRRVALHDVERFNQDTVPNVRYLRFGGRIPTLSKNSVSGLDKVNVMQFVFCGVAEVQPGAFQNLPALVTLGLSDNDIERVQAGVFNRLNVSVLFLQRNQITTIDSQAFDDMPRLYKIKLNSNKISAWDQNWFRRTPALTEILFRRNKIEQIPNKAFVNIKGEHLKIYLSKNNISYIAPDAFQGLPELNQLWLDRNRIQELDERTFSHFTKLGTLFLSKNKLRSLPEKMFPKLDVEVDILDLAGNDNLTCVPFGVASVVKMTYVQHVRRLDCNCVDELLDKLKQAGKINEVKTDC